MARDTEPDERVDQSSRLMDLLGLNGLKRGAFKCDGDCIGVVLNGARAKGFVACSRERVAQVFPQPSFAYVRPIVRSLKTDTGILTGDLDVSLLHSLKTFEAG